MITVLLTLAALASATLTTHYGLGAGQFYAYCIDPNKPLSEHTNAIRRAWTRHALRMFSAAIITVALAFAAGAML